MKKISIACLAFAISIFSAAAFGAAGEYWEITSKMEMPGMPFAMPARTSKVCMPPGGEKDPRRTQDKKSNCEMTDVKTSGNKVSYKGKCVEKDGTMNMEGESTHERDSYHGTMHMTGKSQGDDIDMKTTYSGKRIGGSCDTEELVKKAQAQEKEIKGQMVKMCDTSGFNAYKWVSSASLFIGPQPVCPGKKEALCEVVRNDVPHDLQAFEALAQQERIQGMPSAAKACNVNLDNMKRSLCKDRVHIGPEQFLDTNCPAEAKEYREFARKQQACKRRGYISGEKMKRCVAGMLTKEDAKEEEDCRGRGYTSEELRDCMGGAMPKEVAGSDSANADAGKAKANKSKTDEEQKTSEKPAKENNPADAVLEGAKKLKGFLRF